MIDEQDAPDPPTTRMILAVDALPYTQVDTDNADQLLRQWIWKDVHSAEVPLTPGTLAYCEASYQWLKTGATTPDMKLKVVK